MRRLDFWSYGLAEKSNVGSCSILQKRCMPPPLNGDKASEVPLKENRMLQAKHYLELVS